MPVLHPFCHSSWGSPKLETKQGQAFIWSFKAFCTILIAPLSYHHQKLSPTSILQVLIRPPTHISNEKHPAPPNLSVLSQFIFQLFNCAFFHFIAAVEYLKQNTNPPFLPAAPLRNALLHNTLEGTINFPLRQFVWISLKFSDEWRDQDATNLYLLDLIFLKIYNEYMLYILICNLECTESSHTDRQKSRECSFVFNFSKPQSLELFIITKGLLVCSYYSFLA